MALPLEEADDHVPAAADHRRRIAELVPVATWTPGGDWDVEYRPMVTVQNHSRISDAASKDVPAQVVSVQGSTTAGKSWLLTKIMRDVSDKPYVDTEVPVDDDESEDLDACEAKFDGRSSMSTTGDVNLYEDVSSNIFFVDYEGINGTDAKACITSRIYRFITRRYAPDRVKEKRVRAVKDYFPKLAYLTSHAVVYLCKQGLVDSSGVQECIEMAERATRDLQNSPRPALLLVHNQCLDKDVKPSAKATQSFRDRHPDYFKVLSKKFFSVDCFTIPVERTDNAPKVDKYLTHFRDNLIKRLGEVCLSDSSLKYNQKQWLSAFSTTSSRLAQGEPCDPYAVQAELKSRTHIETFGVCNVLVRPLVSRALARSLLTDDITIACIEALGRIAALLELQGDSNFTHHAGLGWLAQEFLKHQICNAPGDNPDIVAYRDGAPMSCGCRREGHGSIHRSSARVRYRNASFWEWLYERLWDGWTYEWDGTFRGSCDEEAVAKLIRASRLKWLARRSEAPWSEEALRFFKRFGISLASPDICRGGFCAVCVQKLPRRLLLTQAKLARATAANMLGCLPLCRRCFQTIKTLPTDVPDPAVCVKCHAAGASLRASECGHRFCAGCAHAMIRSWTAEGKRSDSPACGCCRAPVVKLVDESAIRTLSNVAASSIAEEDTGEQVAPAEEVRGLWRLLNDTGLPELSVGSAIADWCRQHDCQDVSALSMCTARLLEDIELPVDALRAVETRLAMISKVDSGLHLEVLTSAPIDSHDMSAQCAATAKQVVHNPHQAALHYARAVHYSPLSEEFAANHAGAWVDIQAIPRTTRPSLATSRFKYVYSSRSGFLSRDIRAALHEIRVFCLAACRKKGHPLADGLAFYRAIESNVMTGMDQEASAARSGPSPSVMAHVASRAWTTSRQKASLHGIELCSLLCEAVRADGPLVDFAVPIVSTMSEYLVDRETRSGRMPATVTYRGIRLPKDQLQFWTPDKKYRVPMTIATSLQEAVANNFAKDRADGMVGLVFRFEFSARGCCHCQYLESITTASHEYEVAFPPYSTFTVKQVESSTGSRHAQVVLMVADDNSKEDEDLELSVWH